MSKVKDPVEKKRLAYERDHYNRGGESNKGWRKKKPLKKAKVRRAFRKTSNDLTRSSAVEEATPTAAIRKHGGLKQREVNDWGVMNLKVFVKCRLTRRAATVGAKKSVVRLPFALDGRDRIRETIATRRAETQGGSAAPRGAGERDPTSERGRPNPPSAHLHSASWLAHCTDSVRFVRHLGQARPCGRTPVRDRRRHSLNMRPVRDKASRARPKF
jgi:hypothetical protein